MSRYFRLPWVVERCCLNVVKDFVFEGLLLFETFGSDCDDVRFVTVTLVYVVGVGLVVV